MVSYLTPRHTMNKTVCENLPKKAVFDTRYVTFKSNPFLKTFLTFGCDDVPQISDFHRAITYSVCHAGTAGRAGSGLSPR